MISFFKRAWRFLREPYLFGLDWQEVARVHYDHLPASEDEWHPVRDEINQRAVTRKAAQEATIAQKNVRLASIARTRGKLKDQITRLKRNKKRTSHLQAELARLTRMELELESGK